MTEKANYTADFSAIWDYVSSNSNSEINVEVIQNFMTECALELKAAVLCAIVVAQDQFLKQVKTHTNFPLPTELKASLKDALLVYLEHIGDEIENFREMVTGRNI
jgi:hypothetical protein